MCVADYCPAGGLPANKAAGYTAAHGRTATDRYAGTYGYSCAQCDCYAHAKTHTYAHDSSPARRYS